MIPSYSKFPTRTQFLSFRSRAKQIATLHFRIMILPRAPSGAVGGVGSRLSVIVPIKVGKRATTRNYFKRSVYDATWKTIKDKNFDCIVMFKPIALQKSPTTKQQILSELQSLKFENL